MGTLEKVQGRKVKFLYLLGILGKTKCILRVILGKLQMLLKITRLTPYNFNM